MGKHTDQRDRTLCLARILYEETDEKHPMPMTEMIRRLEEEGVASERKKYLSGFGRHEQAGV